MSQHSGPSYSFLDADSSHFVAQNDNTRPKALGSLLGAKRRHPARGMTAFLVTALHSDI
jgi:hypothetical protein